MEIPGVFENVLRIGSQEEFYRVVYRKKGSKQTLEPVRSKEEAEKRDEYLRGTPWVRGQVVVFHQEKNT